MLLLHGNAESGEAWNAWMPVLGRRFRVVRPDMRGFGQSTAMPLDYQWSVERIIDDFIALADQLGLERFPYRRREGRLRRSRCVSPRAIPAACARSPCLGGIVSGEVSVGARAGSWLEHIETEGRRELGALDDAGPARQQHAPRR